MHTVKQFLDKIDSVKLMADKLRKTPPSDGSYSNQIENIQADCLLLAKGKVDKEFFTNINDYEKHNFDYSGIDHADGMLVNEKE